MPEMSLEQARRLAVHAQGLGRARPATAPGLRQVRTVAERIAALQIDSVSVLARAHFLPLFSRLGDYDRDLLARLAYDRPRRLFETWAHEASYVPVDLEPALRWRTRHYRERHGRPADGDALVEQIRQRGAVAASDLEQRTGVGTWWNWSGTKRSLELLFGGGELRVAHRRPSFERVYDVPERVIPTDVLALPDVPEQEARATLILRAAALLGIGTAADLLDVFRLKLTVSRPALAELVAAGALEPVRVQGWSDLAYVLPGTVVPRQASGAALVAPFDPLVWFRPRVERLWGLRMRIEIYTPAHKRVHGYYVLPFLLGSKLTAMIDLKADRAAGVLRVLGSHLLPGADAAAVGVALSAELRLMADWLGLGEVIVHERGDLAPVLAALTEK